MQKQRRSRILSYEARRSIHALVVALSWLPIDRNFESRLCSNFAEANRTACCDVILAQYTLKQAMAITSRSVLDTFTKSITGIAYIVLFLSHL